MIKYLKNNHQSLVILNLVVRYMLNFYLYSHKQEDGIFVYMRPSLYEKILYIIYDNCSIIDTIKSNFLSLIYGLETNRCSCGGEIVQMFIFMLFFSY